MAVEMTALDPGVALLEDVIVAVCLPEGAAGGGEKRNIPLDTPQDREGMIGDTTTLTTPASHPRTMDPLGQWMDPHAWADSPTKVGLHQGGRLLGGPEWVDARYF